MDKEDKTVKKILFYTNKLLPKGNKLRIIWIAVEPERPTQQRRIGESSE